jgi:hypothetical protein
MEERKTIGRVSEYNVAVQSLRQSPGFQKALSLPAVVRYLLLLTSHWHQGVCADAALGNAMSKEEPTPPTGTIRDKAHDSRETGS